MEAIKFFDRSAAPRPSRGLPGDFVFIPLERGYHYALDAEAVQETIEWCDEQFGTGQRLNLEDDYEEALPPGAWGFWPSGAVFFTETAQAMWFKFRWC
jgi:hypothetical protein